MGLLCYVEGSFPPVQPRQRAILNPPTHFKWPFPSLLICELVIAAHQPIHAHGEWLFPTYPNMAHNFSQLNHTRQMVLPHLPNHDKWFLPTYPHTANGSSPSTHASTANGSFPPTQPRQMVLTNLPTHGKWLFPTYSCIHGKWIFPTYPTTANAFSPRAYLLQKWFLPTYPPTANGYFPPIQPRQMALPPTHPHRMALPHLPTHEKWLFPTYPHRANGSSSLPHTASGFAERSTFTIVYLYTGCTHTHVSRGRPDLSL